MMSASHFTRVLRRRRLVNLDQAAIVVLPPCAETDLFVTTDVVFGAPWMTFAPASWCWPSPENAAERISPRAPSPSDRSPGTSS